VPAVILIVLNALSLLLSTNVPNVPKISPQTPAPTRVSVWHVLLAHMLLLEPLHAQLVILLVRLVMLLELQHVSPVSMLTSCPAKHALHVILDALLALELENAQHVIKIIT